MIIPANLKINDTFTNNLNKNLLKIIRYDSRYSNTTLEAENINKEINITIQNRLKQEKYIKPEYLLNNSIINLVAGEIRPVWRNNFDTLHEDIFYSNIKRKQVYLTSNNKQYNFASMNQLELIEFDNINSGISIFSNILLKFEFNTLLYFNFILFSFI